MDDEGGSLTDPWRPLPIPMLPANDDDATNFTVQASEKYSIFDANAVSIRNMMLFADGRAKAERDALEMMERAKRQIQTTKAAGIPKDTGG